METEKAQGSKLTTFLKWVGCITAVLSLFAGIRELVKLFAGRVESHKKIETLVATAGIERQGHDYRAAWRTLEQAAQVEPGAAQVLAAQEQLALAWLEDVRPHEGEKFADITGKLEPVLWRAITATQDAQKKADLLAHLGWAYFLRSREGATGLDPVFLYVQAVELDPHNPYAHVFWGHWILWRNGALVEAEQHFAAALQANRERALVRKFQLSALNNRPFDESLEPMLRVANEIRKEHGAVDDYTAGEMFSRYADKIFSAEPAANPFMKVVPPVEHVATFHWLFDTLPCDESKALVRQTYLALLQEAAGQREDALNNYQSIRAKEPAGSGSLFNAVDAGIQRLSTAH